MLELDLLVLLELAEAQPAQTKGTGAGPFTLALNDELIGCVLRTVRLLATPDAIPILYPGIMRELCYRLLRGSGGDHLHRIMVLSNGQDRKVLQAIQHLRDHFRESVNIQDLAHATYMSPTTFHRQFRTITSMAPLQYQKQLRLFEARRLMISEYATVEAAAFQVGYASVSQFSREYARTFGNSPRREVSLWRSTQS